MIYVYFPTYFMLGWKEEIQTTLSRTSTTGSYTQSIHNSSTRGVEIVSVIRTGMNKVMLVDHFICSFFICSDIGPSNLLTLFCVKLVLTFL